MPTGIAAIFVFLLVILFHEFGHFIVAKMVGIKVNEFSIGMGPKILQREKKETKYTIRLLPIGGYVSMEGEDEDSNDPQSFNNVSPLARIGVVIAGAIMNFVLAIIVFSIVSFSIGTPTTTILNTQPGSPAEKSGVQSGDIIIGINNNSTKSWDSIVNEISNANPDEKLTVTLLREDEKISYVLHPKKDKEEDRVIIGIVPVSEKTLIRAVKAGFERTGFTLKLMFEFIQMAFKGEVGREDLSGPVGVIHTIGEAAKYGFLNVLNLMGFISVNLGFFNLLPLPALDGSRVVFLIIELIRGKAIDPEKEGIIHLVGFVLLIMLMISVTYSDIIRFNIFGR